MTFISDKINFDKINYKLFLVIILTSLIPTLYKTFRIYMISDIPESWGFNIASQIAFLNVIYEILQEGITLPLFFVLGTVVSIPKLFYRKVKISMIVVLIIYLIVSFLIWYFASNLVSLISQSPNLIEETVHYIKIESLVIPLRVIFDICVIALITLSDNKRIFIILILHLMVNILADYFFLSQSMLNLSVLGIAYSSLTINIIMAIIGVYVVFYSFQKSFKNKSDNLKNQNINIDWKKWLNISLLSGASSAIRNIVFIIMILKLVNEIGESGTFWIMNNFIWGWILLPILALGTLIKQDVGTNFGYIGTRFKTYFILTLIFVILWFISIPLWGLFISNIMGIKNYIPVESLAIFMLGFYIVFAFNNILESYLYWMGRTDLIFYKSLLVNFIYYGIAFILYLMNIFIPNLYSIASLLDLE